MRFWIASSTFFVSSILWLNFLFPLASHGVRTVDNLRIHCGITDPVKLEVSSRQNLWGENLIVSILPTQEEAVRFEQEIVNTSRVNGKEGIVLLPGVKEIIDSVFLSITYWWFQNSNSNYSCQKPRLPRKRDGLYARRRLSNTPLLLLESLKSQSLKPLSPPRTLRKENQSMQFIPRPKYTTSDLSDSPDPYLLGAKLLGVQPERCESDGCSAFVLIYNLSRSGGWGRTRRNRKWAYSWL